MAQVTQFGCGRRPAVTGVALGCGPTASTVQSPRHLSIHTAEFNATAMWHICNIEGYLQRKLHRQWRHRGS